MTKRQKWGGGGFSAQFSGIIILGGLFCPIFVSYSDQCKTYLGAEMGGGGLFCPIFRNHYFEPKSIPWGPTLFQIY